MKNGTIAYLDPDKDGHLPSHTFSFTPTLTRQFKDLLKVNYNKIMAQDFYTGCGKPTCTWCQFVKDNQAVPRSSTAIDELDDGME